MPNSAAYKLVSTIQGSWGNVCLLVQGFQTADNINNIMRRYADCHFGGCDSVAAGGYIGGNVQAGWRGEQSGKSGFSHRIGI
jgi:hypothetical protein